MSISNITLAQDESEKIKASDKFLTPLEKQLSIQQGIKVSPPLEKLQPQNNLPNPEIDFVSGMKCANRGEYDKAIEIVALSL